MSEFDSQIAAFRLFNEKAQKLMGSSFVQDFRASKTGVNIEGKRLGNGGFLVVSQRYGPRDELIESFVLTFRFFIQDNERSSLRNLASIYQSIPFENNLTERFISGRLAINEFLDSPNHYNITYNEVTPTNRDVMEVFIYGGLAHADPGKEETYKGWMSFPPSAKLFEACFTLILGRILEAISFIEKVNEEAIDQLTALGSGKDAT